MSIEHGVGPGPQSALGAPKSTASGHGATRHSAAAAGGFAILLSGLGMEQDMELDTAAGMFAGGEESDLQDALGDTDLASGLAQDDALLQTDDDEAAAASMAAMLNAQIPAESSEVLPLPQAVWATMQQAIGSTGAQQQTDPAAPGDALSAGLAGSKSMAQAGQNDQAGQSAKTAQGQVEANPAATSAAAAQGARSKAPVTAERAAQQMTNVAAVAAQSAGAQAAASQGAQRPAVSWTQRAAAAQQRAEATKSSAVRGGDALARASMQSARDAAGTSSVQEWATWADVSQARFDRGGEFGRGAGLTGAPDWALNGVSVTGSSAPDSSIGGIRPQSEMPTEGGALPEMEVAEQVTYWVGRGARNASISVQGLTENPIRIRIAMEGQEASIQFLAEQEQTRQVLREATPHLRELLEREGLTLGEVSVDNSAAHHPGGTGEREAASGGMNDAGRSARGGRPAETEEVIVARPAPRASALPSGRSVDLFV